MAIKFSNNASTTLASAISTGDLSLTVATGDGAEFPSITGAEYFYATIINSVGSNEIVKVTARSGDVFTIVRAQEGTIARPFAAGATIENRMTAGSFDDLVDTVAAVEGFPTPEDGKFIGDYDLSGTEYPAYTATEMRTALGLGTAAVEDVATGGTGDLLRADGDGSSLTSVPGDVITTQGDIIVGDASGDPERLAIGADGQVLTSNGTDVSWQDISGGTDMYFGSSQTFTANGTFTVPSGVTEVIVEVLSGGSGGGGDYQSAGKIASGGASGTFVRALVEGFTGSGSETVNVIVGSGGAGGTVITGTGTTGGVSAFGAGGAGTAYVYCVSGIGGIYRGTPATRGTYTLAATNVTLLLTHGQRGLSGGYYYYASGGPGGDSVLGFGGVSPRTGDGVNATGYGGGGGGCGSYGNNGGTGSDGIVKIYWQ
jgi:hypothetical protein